PAPLAPTKSVAGGPPTASRVDDDFAPPPPRDRALVLEEPEPRPRRMVPMRRIWERSGEVTTTRLTPKNASFEAIAAAERQSLLEPDRREPARKLYTLLACAAE